MIAKYSNFVNMPVTKHGTQMSAAKRSVLCCMLMFTLTSVHGERTEVNASRPIKSHSKVQGNILAVSPKHFYGPLLDENF